MLIGGWVVQLPPSALFIMHLYIVFSTHPSYMLSQTVLFQFRLYWLSALSLWADTIILHVRDKLLGVGTREEFHTTSGCLLSCLSCVLYRLDI